MEAYDQDERDAMEVVKLKTQRDKLKRSRQELKRGVTVVTPQLRHELDALSAEITRLSHIIYRLTGEHE